MIPVEIYLFTQFVFNQKLGKLQIWLNLLNDTWVHLIINAVVKWTHTHTHIWVSFLRTVIGPELCPLFKKFWNLLWPNVKSNLCFFNCLRDFFSFTLTPLHYTEVYPCTLHHSSVVYKSILQCSVVLCSGVRVTWIFFPINEAKKISHKQLKKQGLLFTFGHSKFWFKKRT